jgi:hypothetical protein
MKESAMMFAAIQAVTNTDAIWTTRRHNSNVAAKATTCEPVHAALPHDDALTTFTHF